MSFAADCAGCVAGKHERHDESHGLVPGVIGGTRCDCSGDCSERAKRASDEFAAWLAANAALRGAQC